MQKNRKAYLELALYAKIIDFMYKDRVKLNVAYSIKNII